MATDFITPHNEKEPHLPPAETEGSSLKFSEQNREVTAGTENKNMVDATKSQVPENIISTPQPGTGISGEQLEDLGLDPALAHAKPGEIDQAGLLAKLLEKPMNTTADDASALNESVIK